MTVTASSPIHYPKEQQTASKSDSAVQYMEYELVKYENTINIHRPSYKPPSFASKEAKALDRVISNQTRPTHLLIDATLFHKSYVCHFVTCQDCGK